MDIPKSMKRLVLKAPGVDLKSCIIEIEEVPVPTPKPEEILIRVAAAPIHPSDYLKWYLAYKSQCPMAIGSEGSGIVVAKGGNIQGFDVNIGDKVGFIDLENQQGSYSEYVVVNPHARVSPMPDDIAVEDACGFCINPFTAIGIFDTVRSVGSKAFIHTAAASHLGQMMVKLIPEEEIEIINVVRREDQAELLRNLGAKHVVRTGGNEHWKEELKAKIEELDVCVAFDAVGGKMTGDLLGLLPPQKGVINVHGRLGGPIQEVEPVDLIYNEKKILGFFLGGWVVKGGLSDVAERREITSARVISGLRNQGWSTSNFKDVSMEKMQKEMSALLEDKITGVKLRIRFDI